MDKIRDGGVAWGSVKALLLEALPDSMVDRDAVAYRLVVKALDEILGRQGDAWHSFRNQAGVTYVKAGRDPAR